MTRNKKHSDLAVAYNRTLASLHSWERLLGQSKRNLYNLIDRQQAGEWGLARDIDRGFLDVRTYRSLIGDSSRKARDLKHEMAEANRCYTKLNQPIKTI